MFHLFSLVEFGASSTFSGTIALTTFTVVATAAQGAPVSAVVSIPTLQCTATALNTKLLAGNATLTSLNSLVSLANLNTIIGLSTLQLSANIQIDQFYPVSETSTFSMNGFGIMNAEIIASCTVNFDISTSAILFQQYELSGGGTLSIDAVISASTPLAASGVGTLALSCAGSGYLSLPLGAAVVITNLYPTIVAGQANQASLQSTLSSLSCNASIAVPTQASATASLSLSAAGQMSSYTNASATVSLPNLDAVSTIGPFIAASAQISLPTLQAVGAIVPTNYIQLPSLQATATLDQSNPLAGVGNINFYGNISAGQLNAASGSGTIALRANIVTYNPPIILTSATVSLPTLDAFGYLLVQPWNLASGTATFEMLSSGQAQQVVSASGTGTLALSAVGTALRDNLLSAQATWSLSGTGTAVAASLAAAQVTLGTLAATGTALVGAPYGGGTLTLSAVGSMSQQNPATGLTTLSLTVVASASQFNLASATASIGDVSAGAQAQQQNVASGLATFGLLSCVASMSYPNTFGAANTLALSAKGTISSNNSASALVVFDFLTAYGIMYQIDTAVQSKDIIYFES